MESAVFPIRSGLHYIYIYIGKHTHTHLLHKIVCIKASQDLTLPFICQINSDLIFNMKRYYAYQRIDKYSNSNTNVFVKVDLL